MTAQDIDQLLPEVTHLALSAAGEAYSVFQSQSRVQAFEKSPGDWTSSLDESLEASLRDGLLRCLPLAGFVGEEETSAGEVQLDDELLRSEASDARKFYWLVDPIDGSANFIRGIPHFACVISLISYAPNAGSQPLIGVIVDPCRRETFTVTSGGSSRINGEVCRVSEATGTAALLASVTPKPQSLQLPSYIDWLSQALSTFGGFRRSGAMALDLAWLAAGRLDAFAGLDLKPWDVMAGLLLVERAGGLVSTSKSTGPPETQVPSRPSEGVPGWLLVANTSSTLHQLRHGI